MYEGKEFQNTAKKLYYPGEVIFSNITVKNISFCDQISGKTTNQLLVRPIQIYEFPYSNLSSVKFQKSQKNETIFNIASDALYLYKSNQFINFDLNQFESGSYIFTKTVNNPEEFGVAEMNDEGNVLSIEEKPLQPKSNSAVVGLYMFDNSVFNKIETLENIISFYLHEVNSFAEWGF